MTTQDKEIAPPVQMSEDVEEGPQKNFKGLDDATKFLAGREDITWTPEEEKGVLRKIDFWLLPLVRFCIVLLTHRSTLASRQLTCESTDDDLWHCRLHGQPGLWICRHFRHDPGPGVVYCQVYRPTRHRYVPLLVDVVHPVFRCRRGELDSPFKSP